MSSCATLVSPPILMLSCHVVNSILDDEPNYGPSFYVVLIGFYSPELFKQLGSIKLRVNALFKVLDQDKFEKSNYI